MAGAGEMWCGLLRIEPIHQPRKCDSLSDVMDARDPGDDALYSKAKARVRNRAVTPKVQVPFERPAIETVSTDPFLELVQRIFPLAAANNLPVPLRSE